MFTFQDHLVLETELGFRIILGLENALPVGREAVPAVLFGSQVPPWIELKASQWQAGLHVVPGERIPFYWIW